MDLIVNLNQTNPEIVTLSPVGVINSETYEFLDGEINKALEASIKTLVIDMEGVSYISSAGIGVITKAKVSAARKNAELAMVHLQPQVKKVFEIIRLLPSLNVFESVQELDEYLGKIQRRLMDEDLEL